MLDLPAPIQDVISSLHIAPLSPAYLLVGSDGCLAQWGGNLSRYGIEGLQRGEPIDRQVHFLAGLLPLTGGRLFLPHVSLTSGVAANLHLFHADDGDWVLLLDATADRNRRARIQQRAYEKSLRGDMPHRVLEPGAEAEPADSIMEDLFLALDIAVVERLPNGSFRPIGRMPDWFAHLYPRAAGAGDQLELGPESLFIENFLVDADAFWQTQGAGILKSGIWGERDPSGSEFQLEASAILANGRKILLIELLGPAFVEKHHLLQKGREANLSLSDRERAMTALQRVTEGLERSLIQRTTDLARATERLNQELAEREYVETDLRQREEEVRQAERMHALGKLAAGVAHDVNNVLTVILLSSELVAASCTEKDSLSKYLEYITKSAEEAALLMHQILDFCHRRPSAPQPLNLNSVVTNTSALFRRLMGANIEVCLVLDPALGHVKAEPGHIEQVIMNLAVNARDAMPTGGTLTIRTANVELNPETARPHHDVQPGSYVMLVVTDTGCGMDPETRARAFEPFFTTKSPGKGSGLGLSTVQSIVTQSGGAVSVESEAGDGSTFTVYLPRVDQ